MSVILDTGFFLGLLNSRDPHHAKAKATWNFLATGKAGAVVASDAVYIEAMNYLSRKPPQHEAAQAMRDLRESPATPIVWVPVEQEHVRSATSLFFDRRDQGLSFTDCLLIAVAQRAGHKVATHDTTLARFVQVIRPAPTP